MPRFQPGNYWARLLGAVMEEVGDNQTPCLTLKFDVTHQAINGEWLKLPNPEQRRVKLFMSEKALPYTEEKLDRFGFNGDFSNPDFSAEFKAGTELVCEQVENNGKLYDEFKFPAAQIADKPANGDTVRSWNARWKARSAAAVKPAGGPPAAPVRRVIHSTKPGTTAAAAPASTSAPTEPGPPAAADTDGPPF